MSLALDRRRAELVAHGVPLPLKCEVAQLKLCKREDLHVLNLLASEEQGEANFPGTPIEFKGPILSSEEESKLLLIQRSNESGRS
jgi:hypothetical protein